MDETACYSLFTSEYEQMHTFLFLSILSRSLIFNHRPSSVPQTFYIFFPQSSVKCPQQNLSSQQHCTNEEEIKSRSRSQKRQPPCCSYQHGPLQVFLSFGSSGMSQRRLHPPPPPTLKTVIKFGADCMRTPDIECECVTCAFETLAVLAVEKERLLSL